MEKYVKIINIIDKSGSMGDIIETAINGFNEFITEQKNVEGDARVSTVLFSDIYKPLYDDLDIKMCKLFDNNNYVPGGMTALYDAVGKTINHEVNKLGNLPKSERPEKTLCVILTDGKENHSKHFSKDQIKRLINEMKEDFNWEFIFLAADEEASLTAESMGISKGNSYSFTASNDGLRDAYRGVSYAATSYRMSKDTTMDNLMDDYDKTDKKDK